MGERGLVVDRVGDNVTVKLERTEACAKCKACIAGMTSQEMIINAKNICDAKKDDWVNIEVDGNNFLKAVAIMYGVPLLSFVFGIGGMYSAAAFIGLSEHKELISFAVGLFFTACTYLFIRSKEDHWKSKNYTPIATQTVDCP